MVFAQKIIQSLGLTTLAQRLSAVTACRKAFFPLIFTTYSLGFLAFHSLWIIDPYDLRANGVKVSLSDKQYADSEIAKTVSLVAKSDAALVLVGGSTSMSYSKEELSEAFPNERPAANLAYSGVTAKGTDVVLARLMEMPRLKRVMISVDFTLIQSVKDIAPPIVTRYHGDGLWFDPVPDFDRKGILAAYAVLRTGKLEAPWMLRSDQNWPDFMRARKQLTLAPEALNKIRRAVNATKGALTSAPLLDCGAIGNIDAILQPRIKALTERGVKVDVFIQPFSLSIFADWTYNIHPDRDFKETGGVWSNLVGLQRCAVERLSGMANVKVHLLDPELEVAKNLGDYSDSAHLFGNTHNKNLLRAISSGSSAVTLTEFDRYISRLRQAVDTFEIP